MTKYMFSVEDIDIIPENSDSQFATAKIQAFASDKNAHDLVCDEDTLIATAPSIYNKPILYSFDESLDDFYTHVSPENSLICGFVVPDSAEFTRLEDGRLSLNVLAKIWKRYAPRAVNFFKRDGGNKKVSVEMEVSELKPIDDVFTKMVSFAYTGICILGTFVREASPGANMQMLSFSNEYEELVKKEFASTIYSDVDFTIPEKVKNNAKKALAEHKIRGGANSVILAVARHISNNNFISPDKVRYIAKYVKNKKGFKKDSNDEMAFALLGGKDVVDWAISISDQLDMIDKETFRYFGGEIMPYSNIKDINPALKGIEPPISLAQANAIARQADAVGADKGGWGIAIKHFKDSHIAKDGKWVEKEEMSFALPKEEWGTGESLSIDKSSDSLSSSAWGSVDKSSLMEKVLKASNYKSLVKEVYALVEEGWEEHPSSSLKYPIMQVSGNKLVYNRGGLSAALGRATGQGENSVVSKVNGIYKKLGLDNNKERTDKKMAIDKNEELEKEEMAAETEKDEKKESPEEEKNETPAEEKAESPEEEKAEKKEGTEKKFAFPKKFNAEMMTEMFADDEDEDVKMAKEELKKGEFADPEVVMSGMFARMCKMADMMTKMAEDSKVYMEENEQLKKFKADVDGQQKEFAIQSTLKELSEKVVIPSEARDEMVAEAEKYSFSNIEAWKTYCKAKSFDFAIKENGEKDTVVKFALPFAGSKKSADDTLWTA